MTTIKPGLKHLVICSLVAALGCSEDDSDPWVPQSSGGGGAGAGGSGAGSSTGGSGAGVSTGGSGGGSSAGGDCAAFETTDERFPPSLAAEYLDIHNAKRAQYCLDPLTWDANLAMVAQAYAELGAGDLPHNPNRNEEYAVLIGCSSDCPELGENISWQQPWDYWPINTLAEGWLDEEDSQHCNEGGSHYTQMVQEDTTRVGCGIWVDGNERLHFVCNYLGWQYGGPAFPSENCSCGGQTYPDAVACE
ncbi:MAG: hypothetical protein JRI68_18745 [Deltaproteobacteria bacterium]|nr:hypothetical protein [Deltaproteobacteria bacterium]